MNTLSYLPLRALALATIVIAGLPVSPSWAQLGLGGGGGLGGAVGGVGGGVGGAVQGVGGAVQGVAPAVQAVPSTVNQVAPRATRAVGGTVNGGIRAVNNATNRTAPAVVNSAAKTANGAFGGAAGAVNATANAAVPVQVALAGNTTANLGLAVDARSGALFVSDVNTGLAANVAGIQVGDEILAVNRAWVRTNQDLVSQLTAAARVHSAAWIYVSRAGTRQWLSLPFQATPRASLGVNVDARNGVLRISNVNAGSVAAVAGLQANDQVISVNDRMVRTTAELSAQIQAAAATGGIASIQVARNGVVQTVQATVAAPTAANVGVNAQTNVDVPSNVPANAGVGVGIQGSR